MAENTRGQNTDGTRGNERKQNATHQRRSDLTERNQGPGDRNVGNINNRSAMDSRGSGRRSGRQIFFSTDYDGQLSDE